MANIDLIQQYNAFCQPQRPFLKRTFPQVKLLGKPLWETSFAQFGKTATNFNHYECEKKKTFRPCHLYPIDHLKTSAPFEFATHFFGRFCHHQFRWIISGGPSIPSARPLRSRPGDLSINLSLPMAIPRVSKRYAKLGIPSITPLVPEEETDQPIFEDTQISTVDGSEIRRTS